MTAVATITHPELATIPQRAAELITRTGAALTFDSAIRAAATAPADAVIAMAVLDTIDRGTLWAENLDPATLSQELADTTITDDDLRATFGRQWPQMVEFLTRVTTLDATDMVRLATSTTEFAIEPSMIRPVPLPLLRAARAAVHESPGLIATADTLDQIARDTVVLAVIAAASIVLRHYTVPFAPHPAALRPAEVNRLAGPWQHAIGTLPRPF
ncbi:hypothetical protein GS504_01375 [Rhodococcus hoagii]|nr:hypothetical protein [Prescottella equi]NKS71676.1 hypothetical protein [Prescottella equi]